MSRRSLAACLHEPDPGCAICRAPKTDQRRRDGSLYRGPVSKYCSPECAREAERRANAARAARIKLALFTLDSMERYARGGTA